MERKRRESEAKLDYEGAIERIRTFWYRKNFDKVEKEIKKVERAVREDLCSRLRRKFSELEGKLTLLNDAARACKLLSNLEKIYWKNKFRKEFDPDGEFGGLLASLQETFREKICDELERLNFKGTEEYNCFIFYNIIKPRTEYRQLLLLIDPRFAKQKSKFNEDLRKVVDEARNISQRIDKMEAQKNYILDTNVYFLSESFWKLFFEGYKKNFSGKLKLLREGKLDDEFKKYHRHLYGFFIKTDGFLYPIRKVQRIRQTRLNGGEKEALEILHERISQDKDGNFYTADLKAFEKGRNIFQGDENRIQFPLRFFVDFITFLHKFRIKDFAVKLRSKFQIIHDELGENIVEQIKKDFERELREVLPDFFRYVESSIVLHATKGP